MLLVVLVARNSYGSARDCTLSMTGPLQDRKTSRHCASLQPYRGLSQWHRR